MIHKATGGDFARSHRPPKTRRQNKVPLEPDREIVHVVFTCYTCYST